MPLFEIDPSIIELFESAADSLLSPIFGVASDVVLVFETNSGQDCPNCLYLPVLKTSGRRYNTANPNPIGPYNISFSSGSCPLCLGKGRIETLGVPNAITVSMLVMPNPTGTEDAFTEIGGVDLTKTIYWGGAFSDDRQNIERCDHAIMRGDKVKRIGPISPLGIRDDRYIECYWQKI